MHNYFVVFQKDGAETTEKFPASNPGHAFVLCQKKYPGAKMIRAERWGTRQYEGWTFYDPPPVQRDPVPEPRPYREPDDTDGAFPFFDEVKRVARKRSRA